MPDILTIIIVVCVVVLGAIFIPKFKKSGLLSPEIIDSAKDALGIVELVLNSVDVKEAFKNKTKFIVDLSYDVVEYTSAISDDVDKADISIKAVNEILAKLKVDVSDNDKKLIEITVRDGLNIFDKK